MKAGLFFFAWFNSARDKACVGVRIDVGIGKRAFINAFVWHLKHPCNVHINTVLKRSDMSRTVFCRKYQKELEGLDAPPYPGPKGQELYESVSKKAWEEWQSHQTMLINEKGLNMMDPEARKYLQQQLEKFLSGEDFDRAEGYVPTGGDDA